jgi:preprotein translocase subunit SecG
MKIYTIYKTDVTYEKNNLNRIKSELKLIFIINLIFLRNSKKKRKPGKE